MNDNLKNIPTYGDVVSSMEYEKRIERRIWLKRNKSRLLAGSIFCIVCMIVIAFLLLAF